MATVDDHVVDAEAPLLGRGDGGQGVADRRVAQVDERARRLGATPRSPRSASRPGVLNNTSSSSVERSLDADDEVGVGDVVDQRHVLVADALDVVVAEAVVEHGRALEGLDGNDPAPWLSFR